MTLPKEGSTERTRVIVGESLDKTYDGGLSSGYV